MPEKAVEVTELLHRWRRGDRAAEGELFELVLPNLRRLAHYFMRGERPGHILQPTELVDQIYFKLVAAKDRDWRNRAHFFAIAARAMRRYLIDLARASPDAEFIGLEDMREALPAGSGKLDLAITIERLLDEMAGTRPDWCMVVEMKYFLGLTDEEAADALGMPQRTMQRNWRNARQWLFDRIDPSRSRAEHASEQSAG
jgi:RNA polymerase sigma factor (TIGR02999 family)